MSDSLWPHRTQHTRLPCPSPSPGAYSNSCPLSRWCHPTISPSVIPFSSCLLSFKALGSFPVSWLFPSGGQSITLSASASILPMNFQGWGPLGLTGLISLLSKGLSRVFFSTKIQSHQFFGAQPSLWSNSHIYTLLLEKPSLWLYRPFWWSNGTNKTVHTRTQEKGAVTPQETEPDFPVSVWESLAEAWVNSGLLWGQGHWLA